MIMIRFGDSVTVSLSHFAQCYTNSDEVPAFALASRVLVLALALRVVICRQASTMEIMT